MFTNDLIIVIIVTVLLLGVLYNAIMGKEMSATSASEDTLQQLLSEVKAIKEIVQTLVVPPPKQPPPTPQLHNSPDPEEEEEAKSAQEFPRTRLESPPPQDEEEEEEQPPFFANPYNAVAYGFFKMLKDGPGEQPSVGTYNYRIIRHTGADQCEIYEEDLHKALLVYLLDVHTMQGRQFTKRLLRRITEIMTTTGWNSHFDAARRTRISLTLDHIPFSDWVDNLPDLQF